MSPWSLITRRHNKGTLDAYANKPWAGLLYLYCSTNPRFGQLDLCQDCWSSQLYSTHSSPEPFPIFCPSPLPPPNPSPVSNFTTNLLRVLHDSSCSFIAWQRRLVFKNTSTITEIQMWTNTQIFHDFYFSLFRYFFSLWLDPHETNTRTHTYTHTFTDAEYLCLMLLL